MYRLGTKILLTMLRLSGFELYSRWVPLTLPLCKLLINLRMVCSEYRDIHFHFQLHDNILTMFLGQLIHRMQIWRTSRPARV